MDLPNKHPAGSEAVPAFAGEGAALSVEKPCSVTENIISAPVGAGTEPTHVSLGGEDVMGGEALRRFFLDAPGRKDGVPFVLGGKRRAVHSDSTEEDHRRRETGAQETYRTASSPDAQGRT